MRLFVSSFDSLHEQSKQVVRPGWLVCVDGHAVPPIRQYSERLRWMKSAARGLELIRWPHAEITEQRHDFRIAEHPGAFMNSNEPSTLPGSSFTFVFAFSVVSGHGSELRTR